MQNGAILIACSALCLMSACSRTPKDGESEARKWENGVLRAQNAELQSNLAKAETALTERSGEQTNAQSSNAPGKAEPPPAGRNDGPQNGQSSNESNSEPPGSFKEIVAYPDASGVYTIYFILVDKMGLPTTVDGRIQVTIKGPIDVYKKDYNISKSDFKILTRGRGELQETALGCVLPPVSKYDFVYDPIQRYGETSGTIHMYLFSVSGSLRLIGEAPIRFE